MSKKMIWFITGASRGMGADFVKAALAAGHSVVASGRDRDRVSKAFGKSNDLLAVKLDVTSPSEAEAAVRASVERFGRIDVVVNNAASFYAGYFEELTPEQMELQLAAESLHAEVAPFGIHTTIVNPGFFRTELLTNQSTNYADPSIEDYNEGRAKQLAFWTSQNGQQSGDPAKLARALITIASQNPPPRRFIAGADAIAAAEQVVAELKAQIAANRDLSTSLAFD